MGRGGCFLVCSAQSFLLSSCFRWGLSDDVMLNCFWIKSELRASNPPDGATIIRSPSDGARRLGPQPGRFAIPGCKIPSSPIPIDAVS